MRSLQGTNPSTLLRVKSKAQILVITLLLSVIMSFLGISAMKFIRSNLAMSSLFEKSEMAFYLAEAGIEEAKSRFKNNPNWFTDIPLIKGSEAEFVMFSANGSSVRIGAGGYKMVRESASNTIYSAGYVGKSLEKAAARAVFKIIYDPFTGAFEGFQRI